MSPRSCELHEEVYQLRVRLVGVSPMVWRRLLVLGETCVADLYGIIQVAMGWYDEHLHRFTIHGREYGIGYSGGISFRDDPRTVVLREFGFRHGDKFQYEYDFGDCWEHEIRVEKLCARDPETLYPLCVGGRNACPPENCGGAWEYMALLHETRPDRKFVGRALDPTAFFRRREVNARFRNAEHTRPRRDPLRG